MELAQIEACVRIIKPIVGTHIQAELYFSPQPSRKYGAYPCYSVREMHNTAFRGFIRTLTHNPLTAEEHALCAELVRHYEATYNCMITLTPWFKLRIQKEKKV